MVPPSLFSGNDPSVPARRETPADCCRFGSRGGSLHGKGEALRGMGRSAPLFPNLEFAVWPCTKFLDVHCLRAPWDVGLSGLPGADLAPSFLHLILVPGQRAGIQDPAQRLSWLESQIELGGHYQGQQSLRPYPAGGPVPFST